MDGDERLRRAVEFIRSVTSRPPEELQQLVRQEAGEELARFFLEYAGSVLEAAPDRAQERAASLMLLGYLVRAMEERRPVAKA